MIQNLPAHAKRNEHQLRIGFHRLYRLCGIGYIWLYGDKL